MAALVFAAGSFVGRHAGAALHAAGWPVVATARAAREHFAWAKRALACDVTDAAAVAAAVEQARPDVIVQCAGATRGQGPDVCCAVHVQGAMNVLAAARRHAPEAVVVLLGSAAEYGPTPAEALPTGEDHPARPATTYGASKLAQTELARAACARWGLRALVVRPFNVIGPGLPPQYFLGALADRLLAQDARRDGWQFPLRDPSATRDFIDVRDVADGLVALVQRAAPRPGECAVYNLASGVEVPLRKAASWLGQLAGGLAPVEAGVSGPPSRSCGDAARARRVSGWAPRVGWRQSVADLWDHRRAACGPRLSA